MKAVEIAAEQAEDEGLWCIAVYASEAYLQAALRRLTAAVEDEDREWDLMRLDRDSFQAQVKRLEAALVSIKEYWNGSETEGALYYIVATASAALEARDE